MVIYYLLGYIAVTFIVYIILCFSRLGDGYKVEGRIMLSTFWLVLAVAHIFIFPFVLIEWVAKRYRND